MNGAKRIRESLMPHASSPAIEPMSTAIKNKQIRCVLGVLNACGIKINKRILFNASETKIVIKRNCGVFKKLNKPIIIIDLILKSVYTTTSLSRYKLYFFFNISNYKGTNMISFVSFASIVLPFALAIFVLLRFPPTD